MSVGDAAGKQSGHMGRRQLLADSGGGSQRIHLLASTPGKDFLFFNANHHYNGDIKNGHLFGLFILNEAACTALNNVLYRRGF